MFDGRKRNKRKNIHMYIVCSECSFVYRKNALCVMGALFVCIIAKKICCGEYILAFERLEEIERKKMYCARGRKKNILCVGNVNLLARKMHLCNRCIVWLHRSK